MLRITNNTISAFDEIFALTEFFRVCYPDQVPGEIYKFYGMLDNTEVTYVRFETEQGPKTFVIQSDHYNRFKELDPAKESYDTFLEWAENPNHNPDMIHRGYKRNITKLPIEFNRVTLVGSVEGKPSPLPIDGLLNGNLLELDHAVSSFQKKLRNQLAETTKLAMRLGGLIKERDHDLYLSFKGVNNFTEINVGLDRVYPKLPESGEYMLGDKPIDPNDWIEFSKEVQVLVKRVHHANKSINRGIKDFQGRLCKHPFIQKAFADELKTQLMASSHFMKQIYSLNKEHARKVIEAEANDVLRKLSERGGNIGLDLNSWIVWNYDAEGEPQEIKDDDMDFRKHLYNRYTTSFVEALYAFLLETPSPYIKPYSHREVVTEDDGIAIGSIRQVK